MRPVNSVAKQFGLNLARARDRAGMTQEELSLRANVHRTEVGLLERGGRLPRFDTIAKLAGSLAEGPAVFFEGVAWDPGDFKSGGFDVRAPELDG